MARRKAPDADRLALDAEALKMRFRQLDARLGVLTVDSPLAPVPALLRFRPKVLARREAAAATADPAERLRLALDLADEIRAKVGRVAWLPDSADWRPT